MTFQIVIERDDDGIWAAEIQDTTVSYDGRGKSVITGDSATAPEEAVSNVLRAYRKRWPLGTQTPFRYVPLRPVLPENHDD